MSEPLLFLLSLASLQVQVTGKIRYVSPDSRTLMADDFPQGSDLCSNFDGNPLNSIDPQSFHNFYACKYGPLKVHKAYEIYLLQPAVVAEPKLYGRDMGGEQGR